MAYFAGLAFLGAPSPKPAELGMEVIRAAVAWVVEASLVPVTTAEDVRPAKPKPASPLCSLNVVNEDPAKILQVLSSQTKTNLVLLSPSDKKLTLNLRAVPLSEMIRHVCALSGLRHLLVGETYVLADAQALKDAYPEEWSAAYPAPPSAPAEPPKPATVIATVALRHLSSSRLVSVLEKFFDKQVLSIAAGPSPESPQVTAQNTSQATGATSTVLAPLSDASVSKTLVIRGPEPLVREVEEMARKLDVPRPQVVIQVAIYDVLDSALREVGSTWNFGTMEITESQVDRLNFGTFQRAGFNFNAAIKALEKKDAAKVLASPNIAVLDGERAFILIGDRVNYPVLVGFSNANTPIFSKEEERVGIYLQVAASVSADDQITLSLYPQVSTISGFLEVNGASYPQISTREAQSTLRIKNGETLVMGGLMKSDEVRQMERVPILGQIPFLGELFTRRKTTKSESQVLIVIRPILMRDDEPR